MKLQQIHIGEARTSAILAIVSTLALLSACSEPRLDGHVYQVNGAGMILPAAGAEIAFLPGRSRAGFFYGPLTEAYMHATADLGTELIPACEQAKALLGELRDQNDASLNELNAGGNLPATPDACFNMCTQRVSLDEQRGRAREQLGNTLARLNAEIANARERSRALQDSRSAKAGELGRRLASLERARENQVAQKAQQLLDEQISKIRFSIGGQVRWDAGQTVRVTLINGTDYALKKAGYRDIVAEGYYQGIRINETGISLPRFDLRSTFTDDFGFDLGYLVPPGGQIVIGDESISDFPGLSVSSPEGRLMAREKGWTANSKGYILPDEIRITAFSPDLFVIPDQEGTRTGATITYTPQKVDFRAEAARKGLPQDAEIARLNRQIDNQSYPEDAQIKEQNALIAGLDKQKKQAADGFNNSALANQISQLSASESDCRMARDLSDDLAKERQELSDIGSSLASCGSESLNPAEVLAGVAELNSVIGAEIETPDISSRYMAKAAALVMTKLSEGIQQTTLTGIAGDYRIVEGIDPEASLALVNWRSGFSESFWFQPLASLGERKDLNHTTAEDGSFDDLVEQVILYGMGADSVEELSARMTLAGVHERSPFSMKQQFAGLAEAAQEVLLTLESSAAEENTEALQIPDDLPLTCEP